MPFVGPHYYFPASGNDDQPVLAQALNDYRYVKLGFGRYRFDAPVPMPTESKLEGIFRSTRVCKNFNGELFLIAVNNTSFRDLYAEPWTEDGNFTGPCFKFSGQSSGGCMFDRVGGWTNDHCVLFADANSGAGFIGYKLDFGPWAKINDVWWSDPDKFSYKLPDAQDSIGSGIRRFFNTVGSFDFAAATATRVEHGNMQKARFTPLTRGCKIRETRFALPGDLDIHGSGISLFDCDTTNRTILHPDVNNSDFWQYQGGWIINNATGSQAVRVHDSNIWVP